MIRAHHLNDRIHLAVIGGNGFIGRHLIHRLSQYPDLRIWAIDKRIHRTTIDTSNFKAILEQIKMDVSTPGALSTWFKAHPMDVVVYCAGYENITDGLHPSYMEDFRSMGALVNTLEAIKNMEYRDSADTVPYFMYLSSWAVYGFNKKKVSKEEDTLLPANYSGMLKMAAEDLVGRFCTKLGAQYSIVRPTEVFGMQHHKRLEDHRFWPGYVSYFIDEIVKRPEELEVFSPSTKVDLIHINYLTKVMSHLISNRISGIYNVSSGSSIKLSELASKIKEAYEVKNSSPTTLVKSNRLKIEDMTIDSSKIRSMVPYDFSKYDLDTFIADYIPIRRLEISKALAIEQIMSENFLIDSTAVKARDEYEKRQDRRAVQYSYIKEIAGDQFKNINYANFQQRAQELLDTRKPNLTIKDIVGNISKNQTGDPAHEDLKTSSDK